MPIIDTLLEKIGLQRKSHIDNLPLVSGVSSSDPFTLWISSKKVSPFKILDGLFSSWSYACIRAIAEEMANMKFKLIRINKDGTEEEITSHPLLDQLEAVNQFQTGYELKYLTSAHLEMVGNAYWLLEGVEDEADTPSAIYPLNPKYIRILKAPLPEFIRGYEYRVSGKIQKLEPYQIIHFKYPDPNDPYEGIGTMQAIHSWIEADNFATEFNRNFFKNGARIGGFLESENAITPEQLDYLKKSFESIFRGVENAYKIAALPKGTTFKEGIQTQKDMDFANLMLAMRDKILAGFRVPRTVLGITDDVNRANAETTNYVFALRTLKPKMQLIVSYLNEFLVPRYGEDIYLSFEDPVPENREQKIQEMQAALASQPVMSINEAREEYFGKPPIENGDSVMTDFSKIPLGRPIKQTKKPQHKSEKKQARPLTKFFRNRQTRKELAESIVKRAIREIKKMDRERKKFIKNENITKLTDEEYEILWKAFVSRITPFEKAQAKAIQKFNAEQKKEVLENLPKAIKRVRSTELFDEKENISLLINLSTPILRDLFEKEAKASAELLGISELDILTPEVLEAIERSASLMSESYNITTRRLLKNKLEAAQRAGASLEELKETITQIYDFSDEVRAEQVARTETFRIANAATREAWNQTGVVKTIKWYTAADERVCPWCEPLHGKTISIEEKFFEKGDELTGKDGRILTIDYDDIKAPPLHTSCRCYIRPEEISIE